jgi:predicted 2-oxoglutarate/Fe(II)-dependent dioxygenase YbiX
MWPPTRPLAASPWHGALGRRTLVTMNSASAWNRRHLPSSPFKPPPEDPPAEQYEVGDLVTHDKYGLGRVILVDGVASVVVDFAAGKLRIMTPFARMTKL